MLRFSQIFLFFIFVAALSALLFFCLPVAMQTFRQYLQIKFFGASLSAAPVAPIVIPAEAGSKSPSINNVKTAESILVPQQNIEDKLDDIAERLDVIKQQVDELVAISVSNSKSQAPNPNQILNSNDQKPKVKIEEIPEVSVAEQVIEEAPVAISIRRGGGGSAPAVVYPKILISEIQILPIGQRFIELYNPNDANVSLTDWYLQRKTETSNSFNSLVSSTKFENKTILAKNYFLISRQDSAADIFLDDLTLTENNSFALKDPNREISDELNLTGLNPDENKSLCRVDFFNLNWEVCTPTPKTGNIKYIEPVIALNDFNTDPIETLTPSDSPATLPNVSVLDTVSSSDFKAIVINEIQTEGQAANDEFVELYNPNNFDVDLSGYSLKKKTSSGNESNLISSSKFSGTILAKRYFLIAPQNNDDGTANYTGSAPPDLFYSGKYYSVAKDNTVLLYDKSGNLIDKVGFGSAQDFETSSALNPGKGKSITRTEGTDTNNNSKDFIVSDLPTPKSP